jgi:hypothetical protein
VNKDGNEEGINVTPEDEDGFIAELKKHAPDVKLDLRKPRNN